MFQSLKRVTYQVPDIDKARHWYCEILNKEPVLDTPFFVVFAIGDALLTLVPATNSSPGSGERVVAYWGVDDIETAYQRLLECGAAPQAEISTIVDTRIAKVVDPFGNILGITDKISDNKQRSVENQPSETAMTVAFCRALAANDEREELKGPDYLAEIFLTEDGKRPLKERTAREFVINKLITPALYGYFIARTAYFDHIFEQALRENIPQIVFLGAGYDSRPYRFKELIKDTRIFELDIKPTQQRKKELLKQSNIPLPEQLIYVSINFNSDTLEDALFRAGFANHKTTLFIWEGVSYYLPAQAVNDTLNFIKRNSPIGSSLCFDYLTEPIQSVNAGEPFRFWIEKGNIRSFLSERGYQIIDHLTPEEMERKYLTLRDGSSAGKVLAHFCLVSAST